MRPIKRALLSVTDKSGIVEFAKGLKKYDVQILSTGGTARVLKENGVDVTEVAEVTGFPECMDGRVKTLHPKIHGGLLAVRDDDGHMKEMEKLEIPEIDLVAVNLYPFEQTIVKPDVTLADAIENIDIGGPTMLRSAAKNHKYVTVVVNPDRYDEILKEMEENSGATTEGMRSLLALEVFETTASYDSMISAYLNGEYRGREPLPQKLNLSMDKIQENRYGENPHQRGAFYSLKQAPEGGIAAAEQLHGKELSYNNYLDLAAAFEMARDFDDPTVVVIKHNNPCGLASDDDILKALEEAWASDPMSAFGSVIGINRKVSKDLAERLGSADYLKEVVLPKYRKESGEEDINILAAFVEAIIAPDYDETALEILQKKKNLRILKLEDFNPDSKKRAVDVRYVPGGVLIQQSDKMSVPVSDYKVMTETKPTDEQLKSLAFADRVAKHVKSNAIVLVKGTHIVGVGAGQMSRFDSSIIAARKAGKRAEGSVLASDAMFPARDGLDAAVQTGAVAILQPGGSKRDQEVIDAANEHGVPMIFTGMRHFKH